MELLPDRVEGEGLLLRCWEDADVEALHEAITGNIEHLRPWMPWIRHEPSTLAQRRELISDWAAERAQGGDAVYGIFEGGQIVGGSGLHRRIGPGGLEIGYWVDHAHLGRSVATRASQALTDAAFDLAGIDRVEIHHSVANLRSARVPERLGFRWIEERHVERDRAPAEVSPDAIWRVTRADWPSHENHRDP